MNLEMVKNELRADIRRFTIALAALEGSDSDLVSLPTTTATSVPTSISAGEHHRRLSPKTRKRISRSMKANWSRGKSGDHEKPRTRTVSDEVKAKISAAQKERWAKQKQAANQVAAQEAA